MDKFKEREMRKKRSIKNTWYDWLINYILEPITKTVGSFKDKVASPLKTDAPEDYGKQIVHGRGKKSSRPKPQQQSEENIIQSGKNPFKFKKENETIRVNQYQ